MNEHQESGSSEQPVVAPSRTLEKYKKKLLVQVVAVFSICLVVILERIFYEVIVDSEQKSLSNLQLISDLADRSSGDVKVGQIGNGFLQFYATLSSFRIQFLLLTHIFATAFVSYDAIIATKVIYVSMAGIYCVSLFQMFYAGARPFWSTSDVLSASCLQQYQHPNLGIMLMILIPTYFWYCSGKNRPKFLSVGQIVGLMSWLILIGLVQFINYFLGLVYIINLVIGIVFCVLFAMVTQSCNALIDKAIKKSTILKLDAKKYVFYWLLLICLLETFIIIAYSAQQVFLDINWVKNFMSCVSYLNYEDRSYRYDQIIGPWFNFLQTAAMFGWIGAVFGISASFRNIQSIEWYAGTLKQRVYRALITNLLIIPSWIFVLLIEQRSEWIVDIGLNAFIVDSVHFFVLYIWIFGYMPILFLHRLLKLTNKETEDYYVILQDRN